MSGASWKPQEAICYRQSREKSTTTEINETAAKHHSSGLLSAAK